MTHLTTERFRKLPEEKKESICLAAVNEFALHGYENANTNRIAEAAGISVGSLFTYFENKQNLFLHIVEIGAEMIETSVARILQTEDTTGEKLENLLRLILLTSRQEQAYVRLYHELSAIGNKKMIPPLALKLESYTARAYEQLLNDGVRRGEVRPDLHIRFAAFHLDNVFLALQHAYSCDYYQQRYRVYVADAILDEHYDDFIIEETMKFLQGAILASKCKE
ncbi:MAG TPA: TetR/AcrR family transcriptional regulator [Clostridia bacterium]|nr:TetR/AcrR family transcriptional regulator [Clostridia bacterium]